MTKEEEEAIEILSWIFYGSPIDGLPSELQIREAGEMAIKALEHTKNKDSAYWYKKGIYPGWVYCSNCDQPWSFNTGAPPYCPCCGKKMRKEKE